jgi:hypothetical protein
MTDYLTTDGLLWARTQILLQISSTMSRLVHDELDPDEAQETLRGQVGELFDLVEQIRKRDAS